MAYPQPVPSLSEEEFDHIREEMDEFEISVDMENELAQHREALQDDD